MKTNIEVTLEDIAKYIIGARRAGSKKKFMELMEDLEDSARKKSVEKKNTEHFTNIDSWRTICK